MGDRRIDQHGQGSAGTDEAEPGKSAHTSDLLNVPLTFQGEKARRLKRFVYPVSELSSVLNGDGVLLCPICVLM